MAVQNLIGQEFNYLKVIEGPIMKNGRSHWLCECKCGNRVIVRADGLKGGKTKSCGCYKKQVLIDGNIKRQTLDLTNKKFGKLLAVKPTDNRTKDGRIIWECQCECGRTYYANTHDLQQNRVNSCGCLRSKGEYIIEELLKLNNIKYEVQKTFDDCRYDNGYYARFDFYLKEDNCLIEFDGQQHYYYDKNTNGWNTQENFLQVKEKDNFKTKWCKDNGIPLIRIPYFIIDKIKIEDLLLNTTKYLA